MKKKKEALFSVQNVKPRLSDASSFAVKEAFTSIRTKLMFTGKGEKCPIFCITSSLPADGKTTNAVSLAVSFAMADQKVLLIDGDMRKPSVHRYFGIECRNGLSELLAGLTSQIKLKDTGVANLTALTAGQIPPNPTVLLGSKQMDQLLEQVREHFDYVILDMPPVNIVADACAVAEKVTGYVLVTRSGKNHVYEIKDAIQRISEMEGNIVGLILNDPDRRAESHYGYRRSKSYRYGGYGYYDPSAKTARNKKEDA